MIILDIKLMMKTFYYKTIKKYSKLFIFFLSLSYTLVILNSSASAQISPQDYFYYSYQEHKIPLCASKADISSSGSMKIQIKTFITVNSNWRLVCGANIFTVSEDDSSKALESILKYIIEEYSVVDYYYKDRVLFVESINNGEKYYHGIIVADSIHIIQFMTSARFDDIARNALRYMMKNFH